MKDLMQLTCTASFLLGASAVLTGVPGSTDADFAAFCSKKANLNSNYCYDESLQGTFLIRCRNGAAHVSDCFFDLYCRPDFKPDDDVECYESTKPNPNGDGRAACTVHGLVYSDNGTVYPIPNPNQVTSPSPDYSGQPFPIYYPIGTSAPLTCPNTTNSSTSTSSVISSATGIASGSALPTHSANTTKPGIGSAPTPAVFPGGTGTTSVMGWVLAMTAGASMWILYL